MGAFSPRKLKKRDEAAIPRPSVISITSKRTHRIYNSLIRHALMEFDWKTR